MGEGIITRKGLRDPFLISQSYFQRRILLPLLLAAIVLVTLSSPNANWVEKRSAASTDYSTLLNFKIYSLIDFWHKFKQSKFAAH